MIHFKITNHNKSASLGILPMFFNEADPRSAKEQCHERYAHGGGWNQFNGFKLHKTEIGRYHLQYPEDPPMREIARAKLRDETIVLFDNSWVAIIQPDEGYEVARID